MARFYIKPLRESLGLGDRKVLEVRNGTPPFNWSVTGNDFTLDESTTTERTNFITSSLTAVTDVYAEITVTDADGNEVSCPCIICVLTVCCDDPNYNIDFANRDQIPLSKVNKKIKILGGCPPYHWTVEGEGLEFRYEYTNGRFNYLTYDGIGDLVGNITVVDNCGSTITISCCDYLPSGTFKLDEESTPESINTGSGIDIYVLGGCPPFTWETDSLGYYFSDEFSHGIRSCGLYCTWGDCSDHDVVVYYTITDACGAVVTGSARNTSSHWVQVEDLKAIQQHSSGRWYCLSCLADRCYLQGLDYQWSCDCIRTLCNDAPGYNTYFSADKMWLYRAPASGIHVITPLCEICNISLDPVNIFWGRENDCEFLGTCMSSTYGEGGTATPVYPVPDFNPIDWVYKVGDLILSDDCQSKLEGLPKVYFPQTVQTYKLVCK